ncbi:hypothetical protein N7532_001330 [Penicillium argentinense]|uniref:Transcription factor Rba50 n=1 Tax=Penicillium argentinense TaxID=1131581 RepID=A0A9W9G353_9EURO|nr:uncharacterized protein N7532_001330 [Penicillium argentinense]KAJ5110795.1 hypothetical protein N7532_001330 [Penicillium argentinense]
MAFPGERFALDLEDDVRIPENPAPSPFDLIGEIREREPTAAEPPAPTPTASSTGFPAHRRRNKPSSFKQRRAEQAAAPNPAPTQPTPGSLQDDKKAIGEENRRHLASMSDAQIEKEREELMASLDPGLLQRFLRRARVDDDTQGEFENKTPSSNPPAGLESKPEPTSKKKSVSLDVPPQPETSKKQEAPNPPASNPVTNLPPGHDDLPPTQIPADLHPASEYPTTMDPSTIERFHFPQPTQPMPTLDPSSPNFLDELKTHYFPEITHDPTALSWLQPPSTDKEDPEAESAYHPSSIAEGVVPSAIRFSLRGTILSPSTSLSLPTTLGLHHHGDDPHAAGYTVPELAILSRSTFPAQRCIAWQVLGRILYRLGKGEFGERGGQLCDGLWFVIEKENVVAGMLAEADGAAGSTIGSGKNQSSNGDERGSFPVASGIGKHASASAWAVEGVWLWQKGGGGDRGLLKEGQHRPL